MNIEVGDIRVGYEATEVTKRFLTHVLDCDEPLPEHYVNEDCYRDGETNTIYSANAIDGYEDDQPYYLDITWEKVDGT